MKNQYKSTSTQSSLIIPLMEEYPFTMEYKDLSWNSQDDGSMLEKMSEVSQGFDFTVFSSGENMFFALLKKDDAADDSVHIIFDFEDDIPMAFLEEDGNEQFYTDFFISATDADGVLINTDDEGHLIVDQYMDVAEEEPEEDDEDETVIASENIESIDFSKIAPEDQLDDPDEEESDTDEEAPVEEVSDEEAPVEEVSDEETPVEEVSDEETPVEEVSNEETPVEEVSDEETPEEVSDEETPDEETAPEAIDTEENEAEQTETPDTQPVCPGSLEMRLEQLEKALSVVVNENQLLKSDIEMIGSELQLYGARFHADDTLKLENERLRMLISQLIDKEFDGEFTKVFDQQISLQMQKVEAQRTILNTKKTSLELLEAEALAVEEEIGELKTKIDETIDRYHKVVALESNKKKELLASQQKLSEALAKLNFDIEVLAQEGRDQEEAERLVMEALDLKLRMEQILKQLKG